jgi:hypothetical protein
MRRLLGFVLLAVLLGVGSNLRAPAQERQPESLRKRGAATAEETRPDHFPHRIWAACDFEGQTPDYACFGPTQTKNIPNYPGNITALVTVQVFDATDQDNRHIHLTRLTSGVWQWAILDFTNDAKRNDGQQTPFAAGHKVDDLFFFVKPEPGQEAQLFVDEVTLFDAGKP